MAQVYGFYPHLMRQGRKIREAGAKRDANTVADPKTLAFVNGLLGEAPDEQGFSALHPDLEGIKEAAKAGFLLSIFSPFSKVTKGLPVGASIKDVGKRAARNAKKTSTATVFDDVSDGREAMKLAREGAHLKQTPDGQYVGAPRSEGKVGLTVNSPGALAHMRRQADAKVAAGAFNAPWYDRARTTAQEVADDPAMQSLFARGGAAYSPQATPPTEINSLVRQHNAKVVGGQDIIPRTGSQARNVAKAYVDDPATGGLLFEPGEIRLGKKTGPYADAKDPTVPAESLYKTASDIWHGRVMGYSNPGGKTFSRGFTPQEHGFLTGENLLLADRAEKAGLPVEGASANFRWDPRAAQAATWGAEREASMQAKRAAAMAAFDKDMAKYERQLAKWESGGKKGARPQRPSRPKVLSDAEIRAQAAAGIDQATNRLVGHQTFEFVPGENVGQLKGLNRAPESVRRDFSDRMFAAQGERDPYFGAMQMFQKPVVRIDGEFRNSAGVVERNPAFAARPLLGLENSRLTTSTGKPVRGGPQLAEPERAALDFTAGVRAVMDAQEGVGWNKFTPANSSMRPIEKTGAMVTGARGADAKQALQAGGLDVNDNGDFLAVGKFKGADGKEVQGLLDAITLPEGAQVTRGRWETGIQSPPWTPQEGTGAVTRYLERQLTRPDIRNAPQRLDAAGLPRTIDQQNAVIRDFAAQHGFPVRGDFMRLREIIARDGFQGLLEHLRKNGYQGLPAAAGVGLLDDEDD